jgi:hypothetical protein
MRTVTCMISHSPMISTSRHSWNRCMPLDSDILQTSGNSADQSR